MYGELVRLHRAQGLSFQNIISFKLAIVESRHCLKASGSPWLAGCWGLYRGAWQEWEVDQIEMAVSHAECSNV